MDLSTQGQNTQGQIPQWLQWLMQQGKVSPPPNTTPTPPTPTPSPNMAPGRHAMHNLPQVKG